jgi:hypothetical protein
MIQAQSINTQLEAMFKELEIYKALDHEHLIKLSGGSFNAKFWEHNKPRDVAYLQLEVACRGSLFAYIEGQPLDETIARYYFN